MFQIYQRSQKFFYSSLRFAVVPLLFFLTLYDHSNATTNSPDTIDAIVSRAWLNDPDNVLTAQTALDRTWVSFEGALSRGYTAGTTWVRVKIDPSVIKNRRYTNDSRLIIRILPTHLDKVYLFFSDQLNQPSFVVGDTIAHKNNGIQFLSHYVFIEDAVKQFELILKVRTNSNHTIYIDALSWDDARDINNKKLIELSVFIVFVVITTIFMMLNWISKRDPIFITFFLVTVTSLFLGMMLLGASRLPYFDFISPSSKDFVTSFLVPFYVFLMIHFHRNILTAWSISPKCQTLLYVIALIPLMSLFAIILGFTRVGLIVTQCTAPTVSIMLMLISLTAGKEINIQKTIMSNGWRFYLFLAYSALAAITVFQSFRILGFRLYGPPFFFAGFTSYSVMTTIIMSSMVWHHSRRLDAKRMLTELALSEVSHQATLEKERAIQQSELVTMLTHELKTPMSVVSLALGPSGQRQEMQERAIRAVRSVQDVIERCAQMAHLEHPYESTSGICLLQIDASEALTAAIMLQEGFERIDLYVSSDVKNCRADPQILKLILVNLLENALKYGSYEERIYASITTEEREGIDGLTFCIANAVGKAGRPDPAQLFEKYYRSPQARYRSGSGLGLYLAKRLAVRLGGDLSLSGDKQVRFSLWLPV